MEFIKVTGMNSLNGVVKIPAAKNSVLPIMAASLMLDGTAHLGNVPQLSDVAVSLEILSCIGCKAAMNGASVSITKADALSHAIPSVLMGAMRSSIFYLAPLLVKTNVAQVFTPGGCKLGLRPIDIHLDGLSHMGAQIEENGEYVYLKAKNGLVGTDYTLRLPSVGATETLIMAACLAKGETILRGAAKEPEIEDLAAFLSAAGAKISGAGTDIVTIQGVKALGDAHYMPYADRITAATIMCATAVCGGEVCAKNVKPSHLAATLALLSKMGCTLKTTHDSVTIISDGNIFSPGDLLADVYPAFCTDAAPLMAAALLKARCESSVTDNVFENRFACAKGFNALGASTKVNGRTVHIKAVKNLYGTALEAPDLRGGAALIIAALSANGTSTISGVSHLKRGYENIAKTFAGLGANITLVNSETVK